LALETVNCSHITGLRVNAYRPASMRITGWTQLIPDEKMKRVSIKRSIGRWMPLNCVLGRETSAAK
jgi:hypothetical protein